MSRFYHYSGLKNLGEITNKMNQGVGENKGFKPHGIWGSKKGVWPKWVKKNMPSNK